MQAWGNVDFIPAASTLSSVVPAPGISHFLGLHQSLSANSQEAMILPSSHVKLKLPHGIQDDSLDSGASQAGKVLRA